MLQRFWFQFVDPEPRVLRLGCGVTAYDYEDAIAILEQTVFAGRNVPKITSVVPNVDVTTLDRGHVIPNMDPPVWRGVWFPKGFPLPPR
jgi:hypothetical protein